MPDCRHPVLVMLITAPTERAVTTYYYTSEITIVITICSADIIFSVYDYTFCRFIFSNCSNPTCHFTRLINTPQKLSFFSHLLIGLSIGATRVKNLRGLKYLQVSCLIKKCSTPHNHLAVAYIGVFFKKNVAKAQNNKIVCK